MTLLRKALAGACLALGLFGTVPALAQECMLGELKLLAGTYPARNYAFAHGQQLPIAQNPALFSVIGTAYGGDGSAT